ncbi:imidazolonepropionase [Azospirillum sp. YIM DDC1]|uniref:Imidazolonepropionase n=1 Tax=Azospirillum aestuarii TaxID=2802052 RepID=A0ABS1HTC7_9PROT|nr:imidazolonepropionase [Azospirillum aestuarii]MBK3773050.1 imidazolonepropionase [Azospirillum brasilense]MBK4718093.1 imidazolonepropionase [Azospirillum aestuarii]
MEWDSLWFNGHAATMGPAGPVRDAAIAVKDGRIAWIGAAKDRPAGRAAEEHDLGGRWVTPGLIDCHTHLVFGGNRAREFEMRLEGATYEEIARAGGGIASTVAATRAADEDGLIASAAVRLQRLLAEGVTVVEVKSGYGLDLATERRMLRAARALGERFPVTVRTTGLAAHALPPEFAGRADDYIALVCDEILPTLAAEGLLDAVDAFCERIAFSPEQTARVFDTARRLGLPVKLHADQLSDGGGAALAARYTALSADHVEHTSEEGARAMAAAGTVAVLLPGAFYTLRETRLPPIDLFRRHGVPMAVSTDCNPGTSPTVSLLLMLNMACTLFRLTPQEALAGVTRNAAQALGMAASHGTLEPGKAADLAVWDVGDPAELCYWLGANPCAAVVRGGRLVNSLQG